MAKKIDDNELVIHFLNVGFGDNIVVQLPVDENGRRSYGLVDCRKGKKTLDYLDQLMPDSGDEAKLAFVCATHPHSDHISGIPKIIDSTHCPKEFWDSGFRHNSNTYSDILRGVLDKNIRMVRVSSGMEWYFSHVRITALSPSVTLRNRFATYGVDMNNASIVLRIENNEGNVIATKSEEYRGDNSEEAERKAGSAAVILAGDAEFDSWSHVCQDFPKVERSSKQNPLVTKMVNHLSAAVVKVAHHGSMHSTPLDVYEKIGPRLAVISTKQEEDSKKSGPIANVKRGLFPHQSAAMALEECGAEVLTTDGSYERQPRADDPNTEKNPANAHEGSIVVVIPPGGGIRYKKMGDRAGEMATPPSEV
jgi:beta-lactamase superfamily II metal-dependent hydrolase